MGARKTWKEQEINEATASSNLSSFCGLIHLLFSSHMGFSTSKMGMTAGICFHGSTVLHAPWRGHPPPLSAAHECPGYIFQTFSMLQMGVPILHSCDAKNDSSDDSSANPCFA